MVNVAEEADYQAIKRALVQKMWHFATVALAPWGPADALVNN